MSDVIYPTTAVAGTTILGVSLTTFMISLGILGWIAMSYYWNDLDKKYATVQALTSDDFKTSLQQLVSRTDFFYSCLVKCSVFFFQLFIYLNCKLST